MKSGLFLPLFFAAALGTQGETWFSSDPVGIAKAALAPGERDKHDYTLSVETGPGREVRRLFSRKDGEVKRWERFFAPDGSLRKDAEYRKDERHSEREYFPGGLPREEVLYRNGQEDLRIRYEYQAGKPVRIGFARPEGAGDYRDEYQYLPSGGFRGVTRHYDDGRVYRSSFSILDGLPVEEWHSFGAVTIRFRYDGRGNVITQEERRDGVLTEVSDFLYDAENSGRLRERRTRDFLSARDAVLLYDDDGHPRSETVFEHGIRIAAVRFEYRDDRLVRKERRKKDSRELWEYDYDEDGGLSVETYSIDGDLRKKIRYVKKAEDAEEEPFTSVEELYRDAQVFLRLYMKDGEEVKSEVLRDGKVIRTRETKDRK